MNKYDKIYVPIVAAGYNTLLETNGPVIVLSLEELREIFIAGQAHQSKIIPYSKDKTQSADFLTYLTSKGITI